MGLGIRGLGCHSHHSASTRSLDPDIRFPICCVSAFLSQGWFPACVSHMIPFQAWAKEIMQ
jgi:hypothetical protein